LSNTHEYYIKMVYNYNSIYFSPKNNNVLTSDLAASPSICH
jgi:hypothetical protein